MPYTTLDAIKDEITLLKELEQVYKKDAKIIAEAICRANRQSLKRIVDRVQEGYDFYIKTVKEEPHLVYKVSGRKTLEEEYPALKKAAEQYDIIEKLIDSTPDN